MDTETYASKNETLKQPRLLTRVAQRLGLVAVEKPRSVEKPRNLGNRPSVNAFNPRHMSLMDYARRNTTLAAMDLDDENNNFLLRRIRDLHKTYGAYLEGICKPDAKNYGSLKRTP